MSEAVPMIMPRAVKAKRTLLVRNESTAMLTISLKSIVLVAVSLRDRRVIRLLYELSCRRVCYRRPRRTTLCNPTLIRVHSRQFAAKYHAQSLGLYKSKRRSPYGDRLILEPESIYSAFWSCCGLLMATVSPTSPTLKRAKRRTEMFSPSLPILLAIS